MGELSISVAVLVTEVFIASPIGVSLVGNSKIIHLFSAGKGLKGDERASSSSFSVVVCKFLNALSAM